MSLLLHKLKERVKFELLRRLHAEPQITSQLATKVLRDGLPSYLNWDFKDEKTRVLGYLETMRVGDFDYKFCATAPDPCLYGSIYACMLKGMFGELDQADDAYKARWRAHLDSFQCEADGYFRDPVLAGPSYEGSADWGDGWGKSHLAGHIIIAYARLGGPPKYPFRFLEPYFDEAYLDQWLRKFDFSSKVWGQSNCIMNLCILLQFARDHMGEVRAAEPVRQILAWLKGSQRADTGMWHDYVVQGYPEIGDAIRGAYHFYPLYVYDGIEVPHREAIIDTVLRSQNSWGCFNPTQMPAGACEDIDALEPLVRFSMQVPEYRPEDVRVALQRALVWLQCCHNEDGGYVSLPLNACPYGGHPYTTSAVGESNLFATWFRSLSLAYVAEGTELQHEYQLGRYPGYEQNISIVKDKVL